MENKSGHSRFSAAHADLKANVVCIPQDSDPVNIVKLDGTNEEASWSH